MRLVTLLSVLPLARASSILNSLLGMLHISCLFNFPFPFFTLPIHILGFKLKSGCNWILYYPNLEEEEEEKEKKKRLVSLVLEDLYYGDR